MVQRLEKVQIEGYKSIRSMELDIRPINVLVGANGAGKSNFLELFDIIGEALNLNLRETVARLGGANRLLHYGAKVTSALHVKMVFGNNGYEAWLAPARGEGLFFLREQCWGTGTGWDKPYVVDLAVGQDESGLLQEAADPSHAVARWTLDTMSSWRRFHFHDTSDQAAVKRLGPLADNRALRRDAGNLAAFLYRLRETHRASYDRIVSAIQLVAPFFKDFSLAPDSLNERDIKLEWSSTEGSDYADAHSLSDGTLRFMCLATLLLQPDPPSLVLIDEPELGLHPFAIVQLADLIRSVTQDCQVIVSTQSVTLLNQFDVDDIVVVGRHDGASTFTRLDEEELTSWLDEYAIGELWEKNVIGGRPSRE
ncbi:MAG: AAA family ATPase [Egibacteraceae bacterium]